MHSLIHTKQTILKVKIVKKVIKKVVQHCSNYFDLHKKITTEKILKMKKIVWNN